MRGGKRENSGRKQLYEKTTLVTTRIATETWELIPKPVAAWIRLAIEEKAKRDNLQA
jgi:hypothetical protein